MISLKGIAETRHIYIDNVYLDPNDSYRIFKSSPDGFNWGYGGSGPTQLAVGILLKYKPANWVGENYIKFRDEVISKLPFGKDFELQIDIDKYLKS